jgi:hypothetical protein
MGLAHQALDIYRNGKLIEHKVEVSGSERKEEPRLRARTGRTYEARMASFRVLRGAPTIWPAGGFSQRA